MFGCSTNAYASRLAPHAWRAPDMSVMLGWTFDCSHAPTHAHMGTGAYALGGMVLVLPELGCAIARCSIIGISDS